MTQFDPSLYGILDPVLTNGRNLAVLARAAVAGGCTLLQLRNKHGSQSEIISQARAILQAVKGAGAPLLINDHVLAAKSAGADGTHLGQGDMPPAEARALLGPKAIIGLTVKTQAEAESFPQEMLDYVSIGGVFETSSKHNPKSIGLKGWKELALSCRARMERPLPVIAIAGIDLPRARALISTGADGVAVLSALFGQGDAEAAARAFRTAIIQARKAKHA